MALARHNSNLPNLPPTKQERYSAEQVAAALLRSKGLVTVAARELRCSAPTIRTYISRYATVAAALKEAREGILDMTEARLYQAINEGESWAVVFALKNLGKDRGYVERQQVEHSLTASSAAQLDDAELDAEMRKRGLL